MIIPMLCVTIFVILVVWFLLPRVARLMIHTPTAISIFVCLSMVQLMAVFISMRCTLCGHFLQVALTLILVVGYAIAASLIACKIRGLMVTVCPSQFATRRTLFHVLVGCVLLMLKVSRLKLPVIWLLVSMWLNTRRTGRDVNSHTVLDGIITTIMATIQRINIIGSREGSRNRRRLKANQTGKKFRVGIKSNISTNRNNLISGVDRCIHLNAMKKTTITSINRQTIKI